MSNTGTRGNSGAGILGLIPARGGSEGVPGKNIRELGGKPLLGYSIEAALNSRCIDRVIVSTDDEEIAEVAKRFGADVPFMRPADLATSEMPTLPVLVHAAEILSARGQTLKTIISVQATSPFVSSDLIDRAYERFLDSNADTLVCLRETHFHPFWMKTVERGYVYPFIQFPGIATRRQDLPELYCINGAVYVTSHETLLKKRDLHASYATQMEGEKVAALILNEVEAFEIDTEHDLRLADLILRERHDQGHC